MFAAVAKWFVGSLLHGLGGLIVIFGSPIVFTLVSKGFIRNETSATLARLLICTAALTWLSLSLFYGSIIVFGSAPPTGSLVVGWTNRILITTFILWLLVSAFHTRSRRHVNKLRFALKGILELPEIQQQLINVGMIPISSPPPEELQRFINSEIGRWSKVVHQVGIAGTE